MTTTNIYRPLILLLLMITNTYAYEAGTKVCLSQQELNNKHNINTMRLKYYKNKNGCGTIINYEIVETTMWCKVSLNQKTKKLTTYIEKCEYLNEAK